MDPSPVAIDGLDERMRAAYERGRGRRERFREKLLSLVEGGLPQIAPNSYVQGVFDSFARSASTPVVSDQGEQHPLTVVSRAVLELLGHVEGQVGPLDCAKAFSDVVLAASDRDDAESDEEIDDDRAAAAWETIKARLRDEYSRPQGGFARLMYGGTLPDTRRMLQLAFNRPQSFPRVLVAQSLVGREGLNLHHACRIVVILHPEWNPGVVEQQIGRVDRVDSHWANALMEAIARAVPADQLPRIEIRPVIFRGTYDEHNWQVLRERWDNLRAQLHGIVIRPELADTTPEGRAYFEEISKAAPNFSPTRTKE